MKNWKTILLVVAVSILIAYAAFMMIKPDADLAILNDPFKQPQAKPSAKYQKCDWPITSGNTSPCLLVSQLQAAINTYPTASQPLFVDGIWGPKTIAALQMIGHNDVAYGPITEAQFQQMFSVIPQQQVG